MNSSIRLNLSKLICGLILLFSVSSIAAEEKSKPLSNEIPGGAKVSPDSASSKDSDSTKKDGDSKPKPKPSAKPGDAAK